MDRRQQKTRAAIFSAFESLLNKQPYSKITVQDIIDEANVGRTTFYAHFETKDALLQQLCANLFEHVFSDQPGISDKHLFALSEGDTEHVVTHILFHLKDNGRSLAKLLVGESSDIFLFYFKQHLDEVVTRYILSGMEHNNASIPEELLRNHIAGSFVNMAQWWIRRGTKESPEEMARYFMAVIEPIL